MRPVPLQFGGGLLESVAQAAAIAASLVLVLMVVALGTYAYKQLRGGGVEWPDEEPDDGEVRHGDSDDEWKYY
ncbi:hypothetical protein [Halobaculum gomorrense]|nr:hypothetical protein [Halobaculum gomorrense]